MAGCLITIDGMGTQTTIASQILNAKADYVLALKGNHPTLYGQVKIGLSNSYLKALKVLSIVMING